MRNQTYMACPQDMPETALWNRSPYGIWLKARDRDMNASDARRHRVFTKKAARRRKRRSFVERLLDEFEMRLLRDARRGKARSSVAVQELGKLWDYREART
jgi:siroheme synthase (precorrin-2 oxidase/ferrochelatase)